MTQPDYDRIALALNRAMHRTSWPIGWTVEQSLSEAIKELANEFDSTDIRFNVTRFLNTCLK